MKRAEASAIIEEALNKVLSADEDVETDDILVDWVVVAYAANADEEKGNAYPMFFSNGVMPHYRAIGLLTTGLKMFTDLDAD